MPWDQTPWSPGPRPRNRILQQAEEFGGLKAFQGRDLLGVWGEATGEKGVGPETPFIHERSRQTLSRRDGYKSLPHRMVAKGFEQSETRLPSALAAQDDQAQGIGRRTQPGQSGPRPIHVVMPTPHHALDQSPPLHRQAEPLGHTGQFRLYSGGRPGRGTGLPTESRSTRRQQEGPQAIDGQDGQGIGHQRVMHGGGVSCNRDSHRRLRGHHPTFRSAHA